MQRRFVTYLRVSTDRQGRSGLGLEAQQAAIAAFVQPSDIVLSPPYVEIESGRNSERPQLRAALARCKQTGAMLLIARLDRLARDVHFISGLMKEGVPFVACDMPSATPFMLHIYAAVAQEEARAISSRTKAALAAAKARGVVLGGYKGGPVPDAARATAGRIAAADRFAAEVGSVARELQASGMSLRNIAHEMDQRSIRTRRGGTWTAQGVKNLLAREVRA